MATIERAVKILKGQLANAESVVERLGRALSALTEGRRGPGRPQGRGRRARRKKGPGRPKRRKMSAATRKKMAAAQKKRWAKVKGKKKGGRKGKAEAPAATS